MSRWEERKGGVTLSAWMRQRLRYTLKRSSLRRRVLGRRTTSASYVYTKDAFVSQAATVVFGSLNLGLLVSDFVRVETRRRYSSCTSCSGDARTRAGGSE
jgi:hypothetical protein